MLVALGVITVDGGSEIPRFQQLRNCVFVYSPWIFRRKCLHIMKFGGGSVQPLVVFWGVVVRTLHDSKPFFDGGFKILFNLHPKKLGF